jgi:hypothetical protein
MNTLARTGWTCLLLIVAAGCAGAGGKKEQILRGGGREWDRMKVIRPRRYVAGKAQEKIAVDGKADEPSWKLARWTDYFVDISGDPAPKPWFRTRAKIIWDDQYLYVYAEIEEPHVWATLTRKNSRVYDDNDFEVFIDPNGDHHNYYEFEMNALNTIWELALTRPYWDGGPLRNPENIDGTTTAVHVRGTLNNAADIDDGWSVEIAIPFKGLRRYADGQACPPKDGDQWRLGFSRVEWNIKIVDGKYHKQPGRPEENWVWSPVGIVSMHRPERWGTVQFSTKKPGGERFRPDPTEAARDLLMNIYHRQRQYRGQYKRSAATLRELGLPEDYGKTWASSAISIRPTPGGYVATITVHTPGRGSVVLHGRQDSRVWTDPPALSAPRAQ